MVGALFPAAALLAAAVPPEAGPISADPPHVGPSIEEIVELTDMSSIAVSPDGTQIAVRMERASVAANAFELGWYVVPTDGSAPPRRIADAGEGERRDGELASEPPVWTPDGRAILFRKVAKGEVQIWRAAADGSRSEPITRDAANVRRFALGPAPGTIVYAVGATRAAVEEAEQREYDDGVLIDAGVDPARPLYKGALIEGRKATDRLSGRWFSFGTLLSATPSKYRTIELADGVTRDAGKGEAALVADPGPPPAIGAERAVTAEAKSGDLRGDALVVADGPVSRLTVRRHDGTAVTCDRPDCRRRIGKIAWQGKRDGIVFVTTDAAAEQTLYLWKPASGDLRRIGERGGRWNGGRDERGCTITGTAAYCVAARANDPPRLVRIDLKTGITTTLADPNRSLLRTGALRFTPMQWTGATGRAFTGQLLLPVQSQRGLPLFVTYYLCDGFLRGGVGDEFPLRQMGAAGIAVLCINRVPTSSDLGDQVEQYRIGQEGVTAAIQQLAERGIVDASRVGMGGVSFGGETTMWIAQNSDMLAAISIANTLLSPTYYWFNALPDSQIAPILKQVWGIGRPEDDPARWEMLSPTFATNKIHAPLLMQLPEREFRFNVELAARLGKANKPVELWAFPEETHLKYQPRHKLAIYERNLDWFRFWLQDYVDPDPAKAEQYRRWEAMKATRSASGGKERARP
jgi:dienelactone hydrolase